MNGIVGGVVLALASFFIIALYMNLSDPTDLGVDNGKLAPLSARPNGVSTQATDEDKLVPTLPFKADLSTSIAAIKASLEALGTVEVVEEKEGYIRAIARSQIFRFRDDVEVYFDAEAKVIHYRSQSRVGHSDLGANRTRFEMIKSVYETQ